MPNAAKNRILSQGERIDRAVDEFNHGSYLDTKNKNQFFSMERQVCNTKDAKKYS